MEKYRNAVNRESRYMSLSSSASDMCKFTLKSDIEYNEQKIAALQGKKCIQIIEEEVDNLSTDGVFSPNEAWKLKKKLYPKSSDAPFAVLDKENNLVSDSQGILRVMKEEFAYRLRNREMNDEYTELQELKEYLCRLRLEITKRSVFVPWTMNDLDIAINKLKNNKCKDPHGHINELYKEMGRCGRESLLCMLNRIKHEVIVPECLRLSNVSTIYKGKGSKMDVVNLRGIFKLPIVRNILDKLIHIEDQPTINAHMGQFQVGNQSGRGIRDHAFILHAAVHEAKSRNIEVDLMFTDIKQCFDSVWLDDAINDLYHSGITSRNLNLLNEGNRSTSMCVETCLGKSDRITLNNIVMQGSVAGGTLCSNQLSKLCNEMYKEGVVYMFRERIPIPALAMVDDVVNIALCNSVDSIKMNVKTDEFIKRKKLECQVGDGKCQWLHCGRGPCRSSYVANEEQLSRCDAYKYLGDYTSDGFEALYSKRVEKCIGYSVTCKAMCSEMSLGFEMFSIAKLLLESIFLNGTLVNMETWPNFTNCRIQQFERVEQGFLRSVLSAHSKTPTECLYLELGIVPFRFHLMSRRILYYQTIMSRGNHELTKKMLMSQKEIELKGDFYQQVQKDMNSLHITEEIVESKSKETLRRIINDSIRREAFNFLVAKAAAHSKVNHEMYTDVKGSAYFYDHRFTSHGAKLVFRFRTRMFGVRNNFRNKYSCTLCPLCGLVEDSQQHLFECKIILNYHTPTTQHDDVYSNDAESLLAVAKDLENLVKIREELIPTVNTED